MLPSANSVTVITRKQKFMIWGWKNEKTRGEKSTETREKFRMGGNLEAHNNYHSVHIPSARYMYVHIYVYVQHACICTCM